MVHLSEALELKDKEIDELKNEVKRLSERKVRNRRQIGEKLVSKVSESIASVSLTEEQS